MIDFNTQVIDFYVQRLDHVHETQVIPDQRAFAHYFNNVGAEHMLLGDDAALALAHFYESIRRDAEFSSAWVNLGVLHRREGYPAYAEAAFKQALTLDASNHVAMSNLANLYAALGFDDLAEFYRDKVRYHRSRNPYYLYSKAEAAVQNGDYSAAVGYLEKAIAIRETEDRFYALMGASYYLMDFAWRQTDVAYGFDRSVGRYGQRGRGVRLQQA